MRPWLHWVTGTALVVVTAGATATPAAHAAEAASITCDPIPAAAATPEAELASYTSATPRRLVDTRRGVGGVSEPVGGGCTLRLDLDTAGVPAEADAVALSVTALAQQPGFLSVFPCAVGLPGTSNINTRPAGFPTPNLVVAMLDVDREVCIFSLSESDVLVDLAGWWTEEGDQRFASIPPVRAYDSRRDDGGLRIPAMTTREIDLTGTIEPGSNAAVANLTVVASVGAGFLVAFPCGSAAPEASNLNFKSGEARAVAAIVGLGAGEQMCVQSNVDVHVIVDVSGFYGPAPQFGTAAELRPLAGLRLADSRDGTGGWTSKFGEGTVRRIRPVQSLPFASQSTAVVLNVVATQAEGLGYATVYPCDADVPDSSAVNYGPDELSTNLVTVDLSRGSDICVFTLTGVHLVVDLFGVMAAPDDALTERFSFDRFTWPEFTPESTDFGVECGDGVSTAVLELDLLPATTARINGVSVEAGDHDLVVQPATLTRVQLRRGATTRDYWFRCLPGDFPRLEIDRPGEPTPGWYLTTLAYAPDYVTYAVILDGRGAPVWYKRTDAQALNLTRRSDGRLLYAPSSGRAFGTEAFRSYRIMSLAGTIVDEHRTVDDPGDPGNPYPTDHHDYVSLTGDRRAMLSYPLLRNQDLTVIGTGYFVDDTIADNVIQEISDDDELLWTWRATDHFGYDEVTFPVRFGLYPGEPNGGEVDPFHINSLGLVDDGSDDYIVSARHLDAVFRIDRGTGDVAWIVGSLPTGAPNLSGAVRLELVNDPLGGPRRPHDARLTGNVLTLFDNRSGTGEPARAVAYEIDEAAGTATLLWQIDEPEGRTSLGLGTTRVAPDGSVLVNWGALLQPMFEEFDAGFTSLMRITQVGGGSSYRVSKEPIGSFDVNVLRATAGGAAEPL